MRGKKALTQAGKFEVRLNREAGIPVNICAQIAGVSRATAMRALAELREQMGPEKVPRRRRQFARIGVDTSQRATYGVE
jgi:Fic family protein